MIKKIEKKFEGVVKEGRGYQTPGTPGQGLVLPKKDEDFITPHEQKVYRSGVGMLLYLAKTTRPDIQNSVRELSKCMSKANYLALKELKRVLRFVLDSKTVGLRFYPIYNQDLKKWVIVVFSDSDWAGDKDTRKSVTGYIIFLFGCPICWKSKGQKAVSLSSSEAEFYALIEAAKEVRFILNLLTSFGVKVELPIKIFVDNVGAIFMAENASTSERTKHIDLRTSFVREMIWDGEVKIVFVRSVDNQSDGLTKNLGKELYEKHAGKYVAEKEYWKHK